MSKIFVGCNALTSIQQEAYVSHCQNWYRWGKELSEYDFIFYCPKRSAIDTMRNESVKLALLDECDYIFFYDDDCILPTNTLRILLDHDKDIVGALTYIRANPFLPMVFKMMGEDEEGNGILENSEEVLKEVKDGLIECNAIGFSCVLIKTEILKKMTPPFFITGTFNTEDIYFCLRVQKLLGTRIYCDPNIEITHLVGNYAINSSNRNNVLKFEKLLFDLEPTKASIDRGKEYVESCKEVLSI